MSLAVVYFSETNNTKTAAEYVAEKLDVKLVRIEDKKNTNPMKGMMKLASQPVGQPWEQITDCDRIILMSPVYAWSGIPVLLGFLKKADLTDKEVMIVTSGGDTSDKTGMKVAAQYEKLIKKANGKVGPCLYHQGGDYKQFAGDERIHSQVDSIMDSVLEWAKE